MHKKIVKKGIETLRFTYHILIQLTEEYYDAPLPFSLKFRFLSLVLWNMFKLYYHKHLGGQDPCTLQYPGIT